MDLSRFVDSVGPRLKTKATGVTGALVACTVLYCDATICCERLGRVQGVISQACHGTTAQTVHVLQLFKKAAFTKKIVPHYLKSSCSGVITFVVAVISSAKYGLMLESTNDTVL